MTLLSERLDEVARLGALSTADLAEWCDLAYGTLRSWRQGGSPNAARRAQIEQRLLWLEDACRTDPRLPVPLVVRAEERKDYLKKVRARYERGEHGSGGGVSV